MILVGLGNPGPEHAGTRHNAGFLVVEAACRRWRAGTWHKRALYDENSLRLAGKQHRVIRPTTFMNRSGEAVTRLLVGDADPDELLVILDDVYLPLGRIRIRAEGGSGGHNGLQSILEALSPASVARLRIGVGQPMGGDAMADHVLGGFSDEERALFGQVLDWSLEALRVIVQEGIEPAMNRFNGLSPPWENPGLEQGREAAEKISPEIRREGN